MTPRHRRRLTIALFVLFGASATVILTIAAFQQNLLFFYTPTKILSEPPIGDSQLRVGGLVKDNSVNRKAGSLEVRFAVTDTINAITVSYRGVLPDLFREGQGVVVRGVWQSGMLVADEVLAKHDENYVPPEAYDAIEAAGTLQQ